MTRLLFFLAALLLSACGSSNQQPAGTAVSKIGFERQGMTWPLTVNSGSVGCDGMAYWFRTADGATYGLNGVATGTAGYAPIDPIWRTDDSAMASLREAGAETGILLRMNIGDLLATARHSCGED